MVRQNQIIIALLFSFLLFPLASALTFEQSNNATLVFYPRSDGAIDPTTTCNMTVYYPNNTILIDFLSLTNEGDRFTYNLTQDQTFVKGTYSGTVTCEFAEGNQTEDFTYLVNLGGVELTQERTDSISNVIYFIFALGVMLFIAFIFASKLPYKATFLLLSLLFVLIAINLTFINLQDQVVNPNLESFFSSFTAISFILYWAIGFFIFTVWILTFFVTIFDYMKNKKEAKMGL